MYKTVITPACNFRLNLTTNTSATDNTADLSQTGTKSPAEAVSVDLQYTFCNPAPGLCGGGEGCATFEIQRHGKTDEHVDGFV